MEKFKYEIARDTTDGITFSDIIELEPIVDGKSVESLCFRFPQLLWEYQRPGKTVIMREARKSYDFAAE